MAVYCEDHEVFIYLHYFISQFSYNDFKRLLLLLFWNLSFPLNHTPRQGGEETEREWEDGVFLGGGGGGGGVQKLVVLNSVVLALLTAIPVYHNVK